MLCTSVRSAAIVAACVVSATSHAAAKSDTPEALWELQRVVDADGYG